MALLERKLIVVSNREPYRLKGGHLERTVGGLAAALDPVMRASGGVWITSGVKGRRSISSRITVPPEDPSYVMRKVLISEEDMDGFYNGYSNRFLWPLCHITLDRVRFKRSYWASYGKVNRLFAGAVIDESSGDPAVLLQDYHLALCALFIRASLPDALISLFWHIPWPPYAVFRICPHRRELLEGLLANDLIGFQLDAFKTNFIRCAQEELGARFDPEKDALLRNGRATVLKTLPVSVDFEWFDSAARSGEARAFISGFLKDRGLRGATLGVSVNRLDYTKGLIKCLDSIEAFFDKYPGYRGKVIFLHIAVPTRKAEPYGSYRERVRKRVTAINKSLSMGRWRPVEYIDADFSHKELAALYGAARFIIVSSVYDGMNLVAKEYIASQTGLAGCALVSEFAGSSEDIPGVTPINPYDAEGCADAINGALTSTPAERRRALRLAREHIRRNDIYKWAGDLLRELERARWQNISSRTSKRSKRR